MQLETEKNKLESLLHSNLYRKRDRIQADLQETTHEDREQRLSISRSELDTVSQRIDANNKRFAGKSEVAK